MSTQGSGSLGFISIRAVHQDVRFGVVEVEVVCMGEPDVGDVG